MGSVHWQELHRAEGSPLLKRALNDWGFVFTEDSSGSTVLLVADRPDPRILPHGAREILWWVRDASPEEVSDVLSRCPGWVIRQSMPLESVASALRHLQQRDLGTEGWLRQMLHLATLDELLRLVLVRVEQLSRAPMGAIWIRMEEGFYQRCGQGYPEAPLSLRETAELVRRGEAWLLCPSVQMGVLRLKDPMGDPEHYLGWIKEVEDLLINAWNLERTMALSFRDDLTVARNRRALEADLPQALRDAAAHGEHLSLMFMDVDNLKALNTAHGHPLGSRVLTQVAIEAQRVIRAQDRLYRYGGDEFCIVIPGTNALGAGKMAERLLQTLARTPIDTATDPVFVSMSIGIASYPTHADGAEHLLVEADRALLRAKAEGKGRVILAGS